jgi:hypothetical protein
MMSRILPEGGRMDQIEEPSEELVERKRKQADANDQGDRQNGRRDPFLARRPRDATKLGDHAADEILAGDPLGRLFLLVHQRFTPEKLAGRTGLEPATGDFGDRCATNCATALRAMRKSRSLLRLAVGSVTAAKAAVFAKLQPVGGFLLIFLRVIVAAFALGTSHNDHDALFFFCHLPITT